MAPRKKWLRALFYEIPVLAFIMLCVTTPWTRLLFWVDRDGAVQEMVLSRLLGDVNRFAAGELQFDDITMMILTIRKEDAPV